MRLCRLLLVTLATTLFRPTDTSTVNDDAVNKAKAKVAWRKARPVGCREVRSSSSRSSRDSSDDDLDRGGFDHD